MSHSPWYASRLLSRIRCQGRTIRLFIWLLMTPHTYSREPLPRSSPRSFRLRPVSSQYPPCNSRSQGPRDTTSACCTLFDGPLGSIRLTIDTPFTHLPSTILTQDIRFYVPNLKTCLLPKICPSTVKDEKQHLLEVPSSSRLTYPLL